MKIEKISDTQIRCQLTHEDLAERQIQLSELAYGSEKARALFRDMMLQAHKEYGFTNDSNIPLMIEAIPGSGNSLTLVITKVEDPEELDTRFAKFSPTEVVADGSAPLQVDGADDIIDLFHKLLEAKTAGARKGSASQGAGEGIGKTTDLTPPKKSERGGRRKDAAPGSSVSLTRAFSFRSMDDAIRGAAALLHFFKGESSLCRMKDGTYLLILHQAQTPEEFNRVCNTLSEYGSGRPCTTSSEACFREHGEMIIEGNAVQKLGNLLEA